MRGAGKVAQGGIGGPAVMAKSVGWRKLKRAKQRFVGYQHDAADTEILAFRPDGGAPNSSNWSLRVVPNKFPALRVEGNLARATRAGRFCHLGLALTAHLS